MDDSSAKCLFSHCWRLGSKEVVAFFEKERGEKLELRKKKKKPDAVINKAKRARRTEMIGFIVANQNSEIDL